MKEVDMYTDGACKGNPGAGGFCCILKYKGKEKLVWGERQIPQTTAWNCVP